jgi:hypothetical protein
VLNNRTFQGGFRLVAFALAAAGACGGDDGGAAGSGGRGGSGGGASVTTGPSSGSGPTSVSSGTGGGSAASCSDAPWDCPAGQTCAISDGETFTCLPSGGGASGDECRSFIGTAECDDGLLCVQLDENTPGVCSPFCDPADPARGCPDGVDCVRLQLESGAEIKACDVGGFSGMGGAGGGGGGGGGGAGGN